MIWVNSKIGFSGIDETEGIQNEFSFALAAALPITGFIAASTDKPALCCTAHMFVIPVFAWYGRA